MTRLSQYSLVLKAVSYCVTLHIFYISFRNPNGEGSSDQWPNYDTENKTYIIFTTDSNPFPTGAHFRNKYVNYWSKVYPRIVEDLKDAKDDCDITGTATSNLTQTSSWFLWAILLIAYKP